MWSPTDIVVTVKQGRNLLVKGKSGTNDAYATIELGKEKFVTSPVKSNSPKWFTECQFTLPQGGVFHDKAVSVNVFHKRHGKLGLELDESIGHTHVALSALNSFDNKERSNWYKLCGKKKDSKKERGEVEISFKFLSLKRDPVLHQKKDSPKPLRILTSGLRNKLRRRSEDEDSGLGDTDRFSPLGLGKGRSFENLSSPSIIDTHGAQFERAARKNSNASTSSGATVSARGSSRSLQFNSLGKQKAISVDVLHKPPLPQTSINLTRSNSGGSSGQGEKPKHHVRNRSMPTNQLKQVMGQLLKHDASSKSEICINGSHLYVPGTQDSGLSSTASSPGMSSRSSSLTDVNQSSAPTKSKSNTNLNANSSNSTKRHSMNDISELKKKHQFPPLPALYKPKNFYRLDVKELPKVSTIHEDSTAALHTMTHEQLVQLVVAQQRQLAEKDAHMSEMEDYIDKLLLRVMICTPQLLDKKFEHTRLKM